MFRVKDLCKGENRSQDYYATRMMPIVPYTMNRTMIFIFFNAAL